MAADGNGDGVVDEAEFARDAIVAFAALDKNDDGVLTPDELSGAGSGDFADADLNHDGRLTLDEVRTKRLEDFVAMDRNRDGVLTVDEVLAFQGANGGYDERHASRGHAPCRVGRRRGSRFDVGRLRQRFTGSNGIAGSGFGGGAVAGAAGAGTLAGVALRNKGPVVQTAAILGSAALGAFSATSTSISRASSRGPPNAPRRPTPTTSASSTMSASRRSRPSRPRRTSRSSGSTSSGRASATAPLLACRPLQQRRAVGAAAAARPRLLQWPPRRRLRPADRSSIMAFERAQGMTSTGNVSAALLSQLRAAL